MKNSFVLLLIVLFTVITATAQVKVGVFAGPALVTFGGSEAEYWGSVEDKPKMALRLHGGLLVQYAIHDKINLASGVQYAMKGATYSNSIVISEGENIQAEYKKILSYLEIPVQIQYALTNRFSFLFGPQISFLMAAKVKNGKEVRDFFDLPETEDASDSYRKFDMGLNIGPVFSVNDKISIQLIYQHGLMKIGKYDEYGADVTYDVQNRTIRFSLIYMLKN